ncbi:MAG: hypothetical protein AAF447_06375 [Myxococcota bacterium]
MDARVPVGYPTSVRSAFLSMLLVSGACSDLGRAELGEGCLVQADCEEGALCVGTESDRGPLCMATCDPLETPLCDDGESVCLPGADGPAVCFLGGEAAEGAACLFSDACEPGLVCVDFPGEEEVSRCALACDARAPTCGGALLCVGLGDASDPADPAANLGYCAVPEGT